ncbi:hypothetical protein [Flagellimonas onchidii]|uniref:hypothetical protein n=1 Tax=Flagellimonas onchidii TaxID=2562684 RepID=UPI0010A5BA6A|nr:hypothetical protein [Allomuricauda onchidii]
MPANTKYLTQNNWQKFAKISAAILGSYMVTSTFHIALASWFDHVTVIITSTYSAFILWAVLMACSFLSRNGWKLWGIYLLVSLVLSLLTYLAKTINPII